MACELLYSGEAIANCYTPFTFLPFTLAPAYAANFVRSDLEYHISFLADGMPSAATFISKR